MALSPEMLLCTLSPPEGSPWQLPLFLNVLKISNQLFCISSLSYIWFQEGIPHGAFLNYMSRWIIFELTKIKCFEAYVENILTPQNSLKNLWL
jgi:hypothetical protein